MAVRVRPRARRSAPPPPRWWPPTLPRADHATTGPPSCTCSSSHRQGRSDYESSERTQEGGRPPAGGLQLCDIKRRLHSIPRASHLREAPSPCCKRTCYCIYADRGRYVNFGGLKFSSGGTRRSRDLQWRRITARPPRVTRVALSHPVGRGRPTDRCTRRPEPPLAGLLLACSADGAAWKHAYGAISASSTCYVCRGRSRSP